METRHHEAKEEWSQVREKPKESEVADAKGASDGEGSPESKAATPEEKTQTERRPPGLAVKSHPPSSQQQFQ